MNEDGEEDMEHVGESVDEGEGDEDGKNLLDIDDLNDHDKQMLLEYL